MLTSLLLSAAVVHAAAGQPVQEPTAPAVRLEHLYKSGETAEFLLNATVTPEGGSEMKATGSIVVKILKALPDGKAEAELSAKAVAIEGMNELATTDLKTVLDKQGMPTSLTVEHEQWPYALLSAVQYLPGREVRAGESFVADWKSSDGALAIKLQGTLVETKSADGEKVAIVKLLADVLPRDDHKGVVTTISTFRLSDGSLLLSEGKVAVEGDMGMTFKLARKKA